MDKLTDRTPVVATRGIFYRDDGQSFKQSLLSGHEVRLLRQIGRITLIGAGRS